MRTVMLLLKESGESLQECTVNNTLKVVYFILFFSTPLTPKFFFCRVSAWKGSKLWALTLTLCRALSQWEVLCHHRTHWSICTNCPPWSHSCSRPSAGISAHSYHCCQSHKPPDIVFLWLFAAFCVWFISVYYLYLRGYTQCFILTLNLMTACMWRGVACGDEPWKYYCLTLHFLPTDCFCFWASNFTVLCHSQT